VLGVTWRQVLLPVVWALALGVACGEGRTLASNRADAGAGESDDEGSEQVAEEERGLCSPTIGSCTLDSSASCPSMQPGNDLACTNDGATCHYCPVYNESVSVSRCTEGRWVNTRATCED
jgi:hypothetical protein